MDARAGRPWQGWRIALAVCAVASVAPLFCARHLPMIDLPEHVAAMASVRHYWDPTWRSHEYFQLTSALETPYWLYHATGALLSLVTGSAERANLFLLALTGLAYPYALRELLRALGRDERLALFGCALFWSRNLTTGLLNFVASAPLVLFGLALALRQFERPTWRRGAGLAALSVTLLYMHVMSFALFAAQATVLLVLWPRPASSSEAGEARERPVMTALRRLRWLGPSMVCAIANGAAGRIGASHDDHRRALFTGTDDLIEALPRWLFDVFRSRVDDVLGWILVASLAGVVVLGRRAAGPDEARRTQCAWALAAVACLFYFALPASVGSYVALLDLRMTVFVALFAILLAPADLRRAAALPLGAAACVSLALSFNAGFEVRAFEREEVGHFDELLRELPRGGRLLYVDLEPESQHMTIVPFRYFGSYYRARYGGMASYSFSDMPHWPVRYRPEWKPPPHKPWTDANAFLESTDSVFFEYVLMHGTSDGMTSEPLGPEWQLVGVARAFSLYRKTPAI